MNSVKCLCLYFPTAFLLLSMQRHIEAGVKVGSFSFRYALPMSISHGHSQHSHLQDTAWMSLTIPDEHMHQPPFHQSPSSSRTTANVPHTHKLAVSQTITIPLHPKKDTAKIALTCKKKKGSTLPTRIIGIELYPRTSPSPPHPSKDRFSERQQKQGARRALH